jgi:hypothetical protein
MADGRLKIERALPPPTSMPIAPLRSATASLLDQGYQSIGCMPCTTKGGTVDNPAAGSGENRMRHSLDCERPADQSVRS